MTKSLNVLISGGWGYGNLGDDAILVSTIKLLRNLYPNATFTVLTYNVKETEQFVCINDVTYLPSVHRCLVGEDAIKKYRVTNNQYHPKSSGIFDKINYKLSRLPLRLTRWKAYTKFKKYKTTFSELPMYDAFACADLFVLGGGGYFNDEWPDKVYSHVLELEIAKSLELKTIVVGQSIGPFRKDALRKIAVEGLINADVVSIRDVDSFNELKSYGIDARLIPDTAISDVDHSFPKKNLICIIIGGYGMTPQNLQDLFESVSLSAQSRNYSIRIMVSRLWESDINLAKNFYDKFKHSNLSVEFIVPDSLSKLQEYLGESKLLISQNLHGLIIAWRAGVPGISLNDGRKFVSFMNQTNQSHRLLPLSSLSPDLLNSAIADADNDNSGFHNDRDRIAKSIYEKFQQCLKNMI